MADILVNLGFGAMFIAFLVSIFGIAAAYYGQSTKQPQWVNSARNAMLLTFPLLTVSVVSLVLLLVNNNFEVEYVWSVTSRSMENYLRITALWGGQPGSLLFWSWLLAGFASAVALRNWKRDRDFLPWVIIVVLVTLAFFLMLSVFFENPFQRLWLTPGASQPEIKMFQPAGSTLYTPPNGRGLNPLLRHPGMIIHPPMQYLGFVSFVIPYAFAIAALITGRTDSRWIRLTRRWTLWAWLFLSLGLVLGMRWAYDVLGWGGYWGWDPVEVAALLPWLTATPFLHSVMIQEKRGMFKRWNMLLVVITYDIMIYGTFAVRSGVLSSVHSFAQSAIGPLMFAFIVLTLVVSAYLVIRRWESLKGEAVITSIFSREASFLVNNFLFMFLFVVCLWGINYPMISEVFTGQAVTMGPKYYELPAGIGFGLLLFLMGVCPLTAWRISTSKSLGRNLWKPTLVSLLAPIALVISGADHWLSVVALWVCTLVILVTLYEFYKGAAARSRRAKTNFFVELYRLMMRNRRRYGGYMIHFGIVFMAVGIVGIEMLQSETQGAVPIGGQISLNEYTVTYESLAEFNTRDNRNVARAVISVEKNGKYVGEVYPRRDYFFEAQQSMTIPGVRSTLQDDFYLILVDWEPISTQQATFKLYHNPLINWLWIGSFVLIIGTAVAAWPDPETQDEKSPAMVSQKAGA